MSSKVIHKVKAHSGFLFVSFIRLTILGLLSKQSIPVLAKSQQSERNPELNILALFPLTGSVLPDGNAGKLITEVAIEQINNRTDVLPDHNLKLFWRDSQCTVGPAINGLFELLYTPPVKHMLLGESCSTVCQPIAEASHRWNITEIAFGCSSPSLSNTKKYPLFFRVVPPDTSYSAPKIELMKAFGWKKIATIDQSYDLFTAKHDARIIFSGFYVNAARKVFCEAYKKGLYGPKIAWISVNWYEHDWWKSAESDTDCTAGQLLEVIDGMLYMGMTFRNPLDEVGFSGVNYTGLMSIYNEAAKGRVLHDRRKIPLYYDAIWSVALALNKTVTVLKEMDHPKPLEDFTYADGDIGQIMKESMASIDFQAVMGKMKFDENGDPTSITSIDQQQGTRRVNIGYYAPATEKTKGGFVWFDGGIKWRGGRPPRDATIIQHERSYISMGLYGAMCTLSAVGMTSTAAFFAFNVCYRRHSLIKMSSPNINNVILVGCWLAYCTVFLQEMPGSTVKEIYLCVCRSFVFLIGFSLALGALFSKTWRVHKIMTMSTKKLAKVVIKDSMLLGVVLALVSVNALILVVWEAVDPSTLEIKDLEGQVSTDDVDVVIVPQLHVCSCHYAVYFTGTIYVIQGIMLAFGAFLAWETRKVKVEALNDSKQIGVCIYNVLTLSVLGTAVSLLVEDDIDVSYGFTSAIIILGTSLIQGIIFVPKMLGVRRGISIVGVGHVSIAASASTQQSSTQGAGPSPSGHLSAQQGQGYVNP